jgi:hypothetical protein
MLRSLRVKLEKPTTIHQDNNNAFITMIATELIFGGTNVWIFGLYVETVSEKKSRKKQCKLVNISTEDMIVDMRTKL